MGMCSSAASVKNSLEDVCPVDEDHRSIEQQFASYLLVDSATNINQKYVHIVAFRRGEITGRGIKQTPSYDCRVSPEVLKQKRQEFWETRIEGEKTTWNALKLATECADSTLTIEILKSAGIKLIKRTLQMSYDPKLYRYDLPVFMINEPVTFIEDASEHASVKQIELPIILRLAAKDVKVNPMGTDLVQDVKDSLQKLHDCGSKKIKFFYSGRELKNEKPIGMYVEPDVVVSVFLL